MISPLFAPPPLSVIVPNIAAPIIIKTIPSKQPLSELEELLLLEVVFADALFVVEALERAVEVGFLEVGREDDELGV